MDKFVTDQADGLRRLLARHPVRVIALLGEAQAGACLDLGAALTFQGKRTVLVDERSTPGTRATLADVASGALAFDDAALSVADSVFSLASPPSSWQPARADETAPFADRADVVLVNAAQDREGRLSPLAAQAHDVVIAMRAEAGAITGAYATIKRLHFLHGIKQFRVLFAQVESSGDAQGIYQNLAGVANRYLGVSLLPAGLVSEDRAAMQRAQALGRSVVEAFPTARCAADYRRIAGELLHWPWRPLAASRPAAAAGGAMQFA